MTKARLTAAILAFLSGTAMPLWPLPAAALPLGGAGKAVIEIPPATLPLDGFGTIHDPLQARVVFLANASTRIVIAIIDQTSIFQDMVSHLQAVIGQATATDPANVLVIASHTFSAPHAFAPGHLPPGMAMSPEDQRRGADYQAAILTAAQAAAAQAVQHPVPVRLRFAAGTSHVGVNRNHLSARGWWLGADADGYADHTVGVLSLEDTSLQPVAVLMNYPVQSSVMDHATGASGSKGVTADLAGAAARRVEEARPGAVALFLTGAAGDQMPAYTARYNLYDDAGNYRMLDIGDQGYVLVGLQGERLGEAVLQARSAPASEADDDRLRIVHGSVPLDAQERPKNLQDIGPTHRYTFAPGGKADAPFVLVQIGDTAIVGVQAELSAVTGAYIRQHSPYAHTMVVTMVNGAAKYMPDAQAYRQITYEAMNSSFAAGSAESLAARILQSLATMKDGAAK